MRKLFFRYLADTGYVEDQSSERSTEFPRSVGGIGIMANLLITRHFSPGQTGKKLSQALRINCWAYGK